ncbi:MULTISPECIES: DUF986 family protein [Erwinia]|uniref:UPF0266 membrane protein ERHA53_27000 n=1 Tax=Erwinia rhapontici TaxID=55212 RepID=A0ABM7N214_ERWRD|nr:MULTISPECIES: DUF986 family protein [Erwinia]MBP2156170.1 uncharacterized membrane protein YobD (UPF0266 family) [Erwinia rhapontici]MCS3606474.1 uncharacterized membrane protein YobD (UPF0266 family) [Erwinia rhapontici]NKG30114.1 DUF986 domain-containing protein [Erwinia rhapontici]NNS05409.1 DUF986 domain-containing protein [Erwinia sp. JH02]TDT02289.1 uncharacterized membrane protein YobD (UPF0266 family) [Erwinia rhapontici]
MFLTDYLIILFIVLIFLYGLYDELIMDRLQGPTRLKVLLQRRNKLDSLIFIVLLGILLYKNVSDQGPQITTLLLMALGALTAWLFWIRAPKLLLKQHGFFYANVFIPWGRISAINLSEDGVLVIALENRRLLIHVRQLDDLEKIYQVMLESR